MRRSTALAAVGATVVAGPTIIRAQALQTMHVATLPFDAGSELFYGLDMGFFAKAGIEVEINYFVTGGQITVESGQTLTLNDATLSDSAVTDKDLIDITGSSTLNSNASTCCAGSKQA